MKTWNFTCQLVDLSMAKWNYYCLSILGFTVCTLPSPFICATFQFMIIILAWNRFRWAILKMTSSIHTNPTCSNTVICLLRLLHINSILIYLRWSTTYCSNTVICLLRLLHINSTLIYLRWSTTYCSNTVICILRLLHINSTLIYLRW